MSENDENDESTFKGLFRKWAVASTIHAVRNITETKYAIVQIMWIICLTVSTAYCSYTVVLSVITFLDYDVLTNSQIVYFTNSSFPAVTFCYIDWCDPQLIEKLNQKEDGLVGIEPPEVYANDPNAKYGYIISREALISSISNIRSTKSLESILISCYFNGNQCDLKNDFFSFNTEKASCFTFNRGKNAQGEIINGKSTKFGKKYGLQLEFFSKSPEYCTFKSSSGITAYIHNQNQIVTSQDEGTEIGVGYETNIAVERTFVHKFSSKNSFCVEDLESPDAYSSSQYYRKTIELNSIYNQKYCFQLRCQQEILQACDCFEPTYEQTKQQQSSPWPKPICTNDNALTQYTCPNLIKEAFYSTDYFIRYENDCPKECESTLYHQYVSSIEFPSHYYSQFLATNKKIIEMFNRHERDTNLNETNSGSDYATYKSKYQGNKRLDKASLRKSLLAVNVYYNSDFYQEITEKLQKTFDNLVSDFGGQTGLFLGMSLLSIFEFVEFLIEVIYLYFDKRTQLRIENAEPIVKN